MSNENKEIIDESGSYTDDAQMNARTVSKWYDRVVSEVEGCPFCDLREKYIVDEMEGVVLTMNLFPYIDGHLMLITRRHVERFTDLSLKEWRACKKLIEVGLGALKQEFDYEDFNVLYREGTDISGSSLKHFHLHILPVTSEFMQYEKTKFTWVFQKINFPPRELAERLKKHVKK